MIAASREASDADLVRSASLEQAGDPQVSGFASQVVRIAPLGMTIAAEDVAWASERTRIAAEGASIGGGPHGERRASPTLRHRRRNDGRGAHTDRRGRSQDWG